MQANNPLFSIVIACHNQGHLIGEAVVSCLKQDYKNLEIIILDDASTDGLKASWIFAFPHVKYFRSEEPSGSGGAFNKAISHTAGEYFMLLCADDILTHPKLVSDIVKIFEENLLVGHVTRYYHQFIDGDRRPVRAWRCNDPIELANNPSGLAFRKEAIFGGKRKCELSNKMFVEAPTLVRCVLGKIYEGSYWGFHIMEWDTVGVRIHASTAQNKDYYLKMWTSSPVEEWVKLGGKELLRDHTSLIQISSNFTKTATLKEIINFIKYQPLNVITPSFIFFSMVSLLMPRRILRRLPHFYRVTIGRAFTRIRNRPTE